MHDLETKKRAMYLASLCPYLCSVYARYMPYDDSLLDGSVATFSLNSFSAPIQTLALCLWFNFIKLGRSAELNDSLASLGSRLGKWSMEMTLSGGPALVSTATVGSENSVLIV